MALTTTNLRSWGEKRSSLEAEEGKMEDESPGEQWLAGRLGGGGSLIGGQGRCSINISYDRPDRGGEGGEYYGGDGGKRGKLVQMVRMCNEYRG